MEPLYVTSQAYLEVPIIGEDTERWAVMPEAIVMIDVEECISSLKVLATDHISPILLQIFDGRDRFASSFTILCRR